MQCGEMKNVPFFLKVEERRLQKDKKETLSTPQPITGTSQTKQLKEWLEMEAEDREMDSFKTSKLM